VSRGLETKGENMKFLVRYVHKIAPRDSDVSVAEIPNGAWSNRNLLAKALRDARILPSGGRLREFRVEGEKVIAFPMASIWRAFVLTPYADEPIDPVKAKQLTFGIAT
jgi:hypothetical protein